MKTVDKTSAPRNRKVGRSNTSKSVNRHAAFEGDEYERAGKGSEGWGGVAVRARGIREGLPEKVFSKPTRTGQRKPSLQGPRDETVPGEALVSCASKQRATRPKCRCLFHPDLLVGRALQG